MRDSYTKHFNAAMLAANEGNNSPHYSGLYGALGTRYLARKRNVSEVDLFLELTPFLVMNEADAVEALAEYALYQESPKDADVLRLEALINTAFQSCDAEQKSQVAVAASRAPAWVKFLNKETSEEVVKNLFPSDHEGMKEKAEQGDAGAQLRLGAMYHQGEGVPQDFAEAAKWYRQAAEQGDAGAQFRLGAMYDQGQGVPQDYVEAAKWYRQAAEQGDAGAQFLLGAMYHQGEGVLQDDAEAVWWFRQAADQGLADAQHRMGAGYASGRGVPQDYVEAHKWANLAAAQVTGGAREAAVELRDRVAVAMTPAQIAEAQQLAREWRPAK